MNLAQFTAFYDSEGSGIRHMRMKYNLGAGMDLMNGDMNRWPCSQGLAVAINRIPLLINNQQSVGHHA